MFVKRPLAWKAARLSVTFTIKNALSVSNVSDELTENSSKKPGNRTVPNVGIPSRKSVANANNPSREIVLKRGKNFITRDV